MSEFEKIPPHNDEAEKAVLGAAMLDKDALFEIMSALKAEDFYNSKHAEIFRVLEELYKKNETADVLTVSDELKKRKSLTMVGGRAYIAALTADVPSAANAAGYAQLVAEKAILRKLIRAADEISKQSYEEKKETKDILEYSEQEIFKIGQGRLVRDYVKLDDILFENVKAIEQAEKNKGKLLGVGTGFLELDKITNGFKKSNLIILAARPAMGKTAFALNVAMQSALKYGSKVLFFSFEMSSEELGQRLIAMNSRVDSDSISKGELESSDWDDILRAVNELSEAGIYIDDTPGVGLSEIKNKCRRLKQEQGLDLIVVDYLQLMSLGGRYENRQQEITALSRNFKLLAKEMECPVLLLSQLSRGPETREDHRPRMSDLRESGAIEQDADVILFLYRDEVYDKDTDKPNICEVIIGKNRSGRTDSIELTWLSNYTRFGDMARLRA